MKKLFWTIAITFCLSLTPVFGQMILTEEDVGLNPRLGASAPKPGVMVPLQDVDYDQWEYLPLGNGLLIMAGLGGAYLLRKRRRQKTEDRS